MLSALHSLRKFKMATAQNSGRLPAKSEGSCFAYGVVESRRTVSSKMPWRFFRATGPKGVSCFGNSAPKRELGLWFVSRRRTEIRARRISKNKRWATTRRPLVFGFWEKFEASEFCPQIFRVQAADVQEIRAVGLLLVEALSRWKP